jgi:hypothetical protein
MSFKPGFSARDKAHGLLPAGTTPYLTRSARLVALAGACAIEGGPFHSFLCPEAAIR